MKKKGLSVLFIVIVFTLLSCGKDKEMAMYAAIANPNVRTEPDPSLAGFDTLDKGEHVVFLGEESETMATYHLQGKDYSSNFLLVRMADGREGWVFASALTPVQGLVLPDMEPEPEAVLTVKLDGSIEEAFQMSAMVVSAGAAGIETGEQDEDLAMPGKKKITLNTDFSADFKDLPVNFIVENSGEYWIILAYDTETVVNDYFLNHSDEYWNVPSIIAKPIEYREEEDETLTITDLDDFDYVNSAWLVK